MASISYCDNKKREEEKNIYAHYNAVIQGLMSEINRYQKEKEELVRKISILEENYDKVGELEFQNNKLSEENLVLKARPTNKEIQTLINPTILDIFENYYDITFNEEDYFVNKNKNILCLNVRKMDRVVTRESEINWEVYYVDVKKKKLYNINLKRSAQDCIIDIKLDLISCDCGENILIKCSK